MLKYSNGIPELDPKNLDGWLGKAQATGMLTTGQNGRFPEALGYIQEAKQLHRGNPILAVCRKKVEELRRNWYLATAGESVQRSSRAFDDLNQELGLKCNIASVGYLMRALAIVPDDMASLEARRQETSTGSKYGVQWWDAVKQRLNSYDWLRSKQAAPQKLAEVNIQVSALRAKLPALEKKHGIFAKTDLEVAQAVIKEVEAQIARW